MFVAHFAAGFAGKRAAPRISLGTLVLAALWADLLTWTLVLAGVEHIAIQPGITTTNALNLYDYPISHSLVMDILWGLAFGGIYYLVRKDWRGSAVLFAAVMSHWVLDFIAHRPDMPLLPGLHTYVGLGLYNSKLGMLLVEGLIWIVGIVIYERATRSRGWSGAILFYLVVALLTLLWLPSLNGAAPPVTIQKMGQIDVPALLILIAWAYLMDWLREPTVADAVPPLANPARQAG